MTHFKNIDRDNHSLFSFSGDQHRIAGRRLGRLHSIQSCDCCALIMSRERDTTSVLRYSPGHSHCLGRRLFTDIILVPVSFNLLKKFGTLRTVMIAVDMMRCVVLENPVGCSRQITVIGNRLRSALDSRSCKNILDSTSSEFSGLPDFHFNA